MGALQVWEGESGWPGRRCLIPSDRKLASKDKDESKRALWALHTETERAAGEEIKDKTNAKSEEVVFISL